MKQNMMEIGGYHAEISYDPEKKVSAKSVKSLLLSFSQYHQSYSRTSRQFRSLLDISPQGG